jgi:predicted permease
MWLYRALLWLYPASWRAEYGAEMCAVFAGRLRDAPGILAAVVLWMEALADAITTAPAVQWDILRQDLRYALRALRRSPGFAVTAVGVAALGIGTTTAAYTMVDHVLIRPLPFAQPDRLVGLWEDHSASGGFPDWDISPANYRDWTRMNTSFANTAAYRELLVNITGQGEPESVEGASVEAGMFALLGIQPVLGRSFGAEDDRESAAATVILSYGLWQQRFTGDPAIIGRTIELDSKPYTVIGVMPESFHFPERTARLWTPLQLAVGDYEDRLDTFLYAMGRLKPGVSEPQAAAEMRAIGSRLARAFPKELGRTSVTVMRLQEEVPPQSVLMLRVLLGAAFCVLLIACGNLANLLLARSLVRGRELAVRMALGAGRERLIRQMLTESLLLALAGGALGLVLAHAALPLAVRLVPTYLPIAEVPAIDPGILIFAALLTCSTGIVFGLIPALRAGRQAGLSQLQGAGRSGAHVRQERVRSLLVAAEIAGSIALLVVFGLLVRALWRVQAVNPGFRPEHVLTLRTSLPMSRYERPETREHFYRYVLTEARRLPGVTAAAYISFLPMVLRGGIWPVEIAGRPEDVAKRRTASLRFVTPGFFRAMGIPQLAGRDVAESDTHEAPFVAIVSRSFVARYWTGENPLGRHFNIGNHDRLVIGVVGDVRVRGLERTSEPQVYVSWQQPDDVSTWYAPKDLAVRTTADPVSLIPALRRIIHQADPDQPVSNVMPLEDIVAKETASRRVQLDVLGAFAAMAFLLAAVGIHGLLLFAVSARTPEIGVRVALGAQPRDIIGMTLRDGFRLAGAGGAAGLVVAYAGARVLESALAGVRPNDPATFAAACLVAMAMALGGSLLPALRALRIDPTTAIRAE